MSEYDFGELVDQDEEETSYVNKIDFFRKTLVKHFL